MRTERYTAEEVRRVFETEGDRLFAPWAVGRPEGWVPDPRTKELIALGYWIGEQLVALGCNEDDRKTQESFYNRWSRSEHDLYALAAETLNTVLDGKVEQGRIPLRRWG